MVRKCYDRVTKLTALALDGFSMAALVLDKVISLYFMIKWSVTRVKLEVVSKESNTIL